VEEKFPENQMRIDSQERLTKSNKARNVQNRIWRELVKLYAVNKEKPTNKFVGRKGYAAEKKGEEHHPIAARGLGDALGAGEDDLVPFSNEPILLGLGEIGLQKLQWHPAG
jgi:hypothetical protein